MANMLSHQQQLQQRFMRNARRQSLQEKAAKYGQQQTMRSPSAQNPDGYSNSTSSQSLRQTMTAADSVYDELPIGPNEIEAIILEDDYIPTFKAACQHGPLSTVQSMVSSQTPPRTRSFLHHGLVVALRAGSIDIARYLLSAGAPIIRETPENVLSAPADQQLTLFELLVSYGWTVNTPGFYGAVLLPKVVAKIPLLQWFLAHGADPNLGQQRDYRDRTGGSDEDSCAALEEAAAQGNLAAVRLLLDAGAKIQHGIPLHSAAGACQPGMNPHTGRVTPSKEFDQSRIPVMALLVERGADVNQAEKSRHMVPQYAIVHAVMAGAVERARWLLDHGADAELKGNFGSAVTYATMGSEEMRDTINKLVKAKR